jgi:hypothetical protein
MIEGATEVSALPSTVALTKAVVPEVVPVKTEVYVPFAGSETGAKVPLLVPPLMVKTIVRPPVVRRFPAASLAVSVAVEADPAWILAADKVTVDCARLIAPGVTVIVGIVEVTVEPLMVALTVVAVPAIKPWKLAM